MKVYISGKIGEEVISEATRQKFARAEAMLKAKGYEVFNPSDEKWENLLGGEYETDRLLKCRFIDGSFPDFYAYALLRNQMVLSTKDAVYFLEDWDKSSGAGSEHSFAMATGKKILFASREQAALYLEEEWRKANKAMNMRTSRHKYVDLHLHELWMPIEQK